jgi:hypothetical protein
MTTPTYTDQLLSNEGEHRERVAQRLNRLAHSVASLSDLKTAVEDAEERLSDAEGDARTGSLENAGMALAVARGEVDAANLALTAASRRHQALARQNNNLQTDAARGIVPAIEKLLPGVPVHVIAAPVTTVPSSGDLPVVVLRQLDNSTFRDGRSGWMKSGAMGARPVPVSVQVHYFRSSLHTPLDRRALESALSELGLNARTKVGASTDQLDDGLVRDMLTVESSESAPVPAMPDLDESRLGGSPAAQLGRVIARKVAKASGSVVDATEARSVTTETIDGIRTTTVTGKARMHRGNRAPADFVRREGIGGIEYVPIPQPSVSDLVGTLFAGLGRVVSVETTGSAQEGEVAWSATLTSRTSHEVAHPQE